MFDGRRRRRKRSPIGPRTYAHRSNGRRSGSLGNVKKIGTLARGIARTGKRENGIGNRHVLGRTKRYGTSLRWNYY